MPPKPTKTPRSKPQPPKRKKSVKEMAEDIEAEEKANPTSAKAEDLMPVRGQSLEPKKKKSDMTKKEKEEKKAKKIAKQIKPFATDLKGAARGEYLKCEDIDFNVSSEELTKPENLRDILLFFDLVLEEDDVNVKSAYEFVEYNEPEDDYKVTVDYGYLAGEFPVDLIDMYTEYSGTNDQMFFMMYFDKPIENNRDEDNIDFWDKYHPDNEEYKKMEQFLNESRTKPENNQVLIEQIFTGMSGADSWIDGVWKDLNNNWDTIGWNKPVVKNFIHWFVCTLSSVSEEQVFLPGNHPYYKVMRYIIKIIKGIAEKHHKRVQAIKNKYGEDVLAKVFGSLIEPNYQDSFLVPMNKLTHKAIVMDEPEEFYRMMKRQMKKLKLGKYAEPSAQAEEKEAVQGEGGLEEKAPGYVPPPPVMPPQQEEEKEQTDTDTDEEEEKVENTAHTERELKAMKLTELRPLLKSLGGQPFSRPRGENFRREYVTKEGGQREADEDAPKRSAVQKNKKELIAEIMELEAKQNRHNRTMP